MKYHKIRNVPLSVCTAEQKIAYNLAFANYDFISRCGFHSYAEAAQHIVNIHYTDTGKYDVDAIFCALNAGLESYCKSKYHILSSYEEIGRAFPALYLEV